MGRAFNDAWAILKSMQAQENLPAPIYRFNTLPVSDDAQSRLLNPEVRPFGDITPEDFPQLYEEEYRPYGHMVQSQSYGGQGKLPESKGFATYMNRVKEPVADIPALVRRIKNRR
jgi:hypothetical protein